MIKIIPFYSTFIIVVSRFPLWEAIVYLTDIQNEDILHPKMSRDYLQFALQKFWVWTINFNMARRESSSQSFTLTPIIRLKQKIRQCTSFKEEHVNRTYLVQHITNHCQEIHLHVRVFIITPLLVFILKQDRDAERITCSTGHHQQGVLGLKEGSRRKNRLVAKVSTWYLVTYDRGVSRESKDSSPYEWR